MFIGGDIYLSCHIGCRNKSRDASGLPPGISSLTLWHRLNFYVESYGSPGLAGALHLLFMAVFCHPEDRKNRKHGIWPIKTFGAPCRAPSRYVGLVEVAIPQWCAFPTFFVSSYFIRNTASPRESVAVLSVIFIWELVPMVKRYVSLIFDLLRS